MNMTIPAFHVSDGSTVKGGGKVSILSRAGGGASGEFTVELAAQFNPLTDDYPLGSVSIRADLNDSLRATFKSTSIELINSYGKANPTAYLTGRCTADNVAGEHASKGLRYWLMIADNQRGATTADGTPDVVGFAIHDRNGDRVAYGTGPLRSGAITVMAE